MYGSPWDRCGALDRGISKARKTHGSPVMISLSVLYGFGGVSAALSLAYLVYALIYAEEF